MFLLPSYANTVPSQFFFQVLEEVNFEGIIKYIKEGKAKRIITMAGAGISTCKSYLFSF